ncbi:MAG: hypothetical protein HGA97_03165 [Chlorobiaceae bacterium]|nr:hypothetical protein [Chlorobiaceae bacterium]
MLSARGLLFNARGFRTGYTHWLGTELSKEVCVFSGLVSESSIKNGTDTGLVLEHYLRIQKELTSLIQKHIKSGENKDEFIAEIRRFEQVHIVTKAENTTLRMKDIAGDYEKVGICLVHWSDIPSDSSWLLRKKLLGKVANASKFVV